MMTAFYLFIGFAVFVYMMIMDLSHKRRLENEGEIGRTEQHHLLPKAYLISTPHTGVC